jgi:hypothetical protein
LNLDTSQSTSNSPSYQRLNSARKSEISEILEKLEPLIQHIEAAPQSDLPSALYFHFSLVQLLLSLETFKNFISYIPFFSLLVELELKLLILHQGFLVFKAEF